MREGDNGSLRGGGGGESRGAELLVVIGAQMARVWRGGRSGPLRASSTVLLLTPDLGELVDGSQNVGALGSDPGKGKRG